MSRNYEQFLSAVQDMADVSPANGANHFSAVADLYENLISDSKYRAAIYEVLEMIMPTLALAISQIPSENRAAWLSTSRPEIFAFLSMLVQLENASQLTFDEKVTLAAALMPLLKKVT